MVIPLLKGYHFPMETILSLETTILPLSSQTCLLSGNNESISNPYFLNGISEILMPITEEYNAIVRSQHRIYCPRKFKIGTPVKVKVTAFDEPGEEKEGSE